MNWLSPSPQIGSQKRYILTSFICSALPVIVIAWLPEPWHSSLLPLAALFGAYAFMFGLGLLLYGIEWLWRLVRPHALPEICCPLCHTREQPYRPFYVTRIAPHLLRVHCPECQEHWIEHR